MGFDRFQTGYDTYKYEKEGVKLDIKAFYKLSYGVYVLFAGDETQRSGCIVNTVCQVAAQPATLSVAVNKQNFTADCIQRTGCFAAVTLTEAVPMEYISRFGFASGRERDKFASLQVVTDGNGSPYAADYGAAVFSCRVKQQMDLGTHWLFIGEVTDAQVLPSQSGPMTYAYYHAVKKGTTPPNAPSYKEEAGQKGWRCTVCNYVYEGEELPEGFKCPICGQPASAFERI